MGKDTIKFTLLERRVFKKRKNQTYEICPVCKIVFKSYTKKFCSLSCAFAAGACGKKEKLKPIICQGCQKFFKPRFSKTKYCSRKCRTDYFRRKNTVECPNCHIEFRKKWSVQKFCSRKCSNLYRKVKKCSKCFGAEIYSFAKKHYSKNYCKQCFDEWRFETYLRRIEKKIIKDFGQENFDLLMQLKKADTVSIVGQRILKGDEKWLKTYKNQVRLAKEISKLETLRI